MGNDSSKKDDALILNFDDDLLSASASNNFDYNLNSIVPFAE